MDKLSNYKKELIIFFLSFLSLIYSFILNEDGTGGGAKGDFEATYGFILALQENLFFFLNFLLFHFYLKDCKYILL